MCGSKKPKPKPPPPIQPPAIIEKPPEVELGNTSEEVVKRKKVGRKQLSVTSNATTKTGLGI